MNKSTAKWFKPVFDLEIENKSPAKKLKEVPHRKTKKEFAYKKAQLAVSSNVNLIDQVAPVTVADLAVHNKKVAEVEQWIKTNVISSNKVSILLLLGPTGAGKTATVKVLCKEMKIEISEWINPQDIDVEEGRGPGQTARFIDFLTESSRYPSLFETSNKKIILVEEYPNSIVRNPEELQQILLKFLDRGKSSLVFICTDSKDYHSNLSQQLFPQSLREKIEMDVISFNPVSVTLLKGALKRSVNIIQEKCSPIFQIPSLNTLESIANSSMGDVRSALNSFSFASLKGSKELPVIKDTRAPPTGAKRKRKEKQSGTLAHIRKDEAVGLLHGVGRVLYPKRIPDGESWTFEHTPESLFDEFITQPTTFVNFLHENYIRYFGSFHDVCQASEILSFSELLLSDWKDDDVIAHYGLWHAISGLMVVNGRSEAKWNPVRGPKYIRPKIEQASTFEERQLKTIEKTYYDIINRTSDSTRF